MKKIIFLTALIALTGCVKPVADETPLSDIMTEIKDVINDDSFVEEDLTNQKNAEKYGISSESVVDGIAYYSTADGVSDKVILVRGKDRENVEKLEQALSSELTDSALAWQNDENESKKHQNSVLKTKDDCIILAISEKSEEIEEIFDKNL